MIAHAFVVAVFAGASTALASPAGAKISAKTAPKTILDLQLHKREETLPLKGGETVHLTNLNPAVNAWYLLTFTKGPKGSPGAVTYNLENVHPAEQRLHLSDRAGGGLVIADYLGRKVCDLWADGGGALTAAAGSSKPFVALCDGRVLLRNPATGHRSMKELAVDVLRDHIWGGEAVTSFFKDTLFKDKYKLVAETATDVLTAAAYGGDDGPATASTAKGSAALAPQQLGIRIAAAGSDDGSLAPGHWYAAANQPGVFVSEVSPSRLSPAVLQSFPGKVARLDRVESGALAYLVAFDLNRFDVGFALGTDHPRVDWSVRPPASSRDAGIGGPDGFATVAPLVKSGMLSPAFRSRVVATFAGGFKRHHGAFKWGELANRNHGSHYGFIEDGVVFSRLQPGLATLFVKADGSFGMKTWTTADDDMVAGLRYARQNGVSIIERDSAGVGEPSEYVSDWAHGNWSGSAEKQFRTLRSGICLRREGTQRYLVYGYFSTATPNAMARVFQAYGCEYAMHLDMNAPEHTYMALYHEDKSGLAVEHLTKMMSSADSRDGAKVLPRFVSVPDNRDFVFLYKRPEL